MFEMPIDDVTVIKGRGTQVMGKIRRGVIKVGDPVEITGPGGKSTSSVVTGVQISQRLVGDAAEGDTVGVLLRGVRSEDVARGHVLRAR
jgi:elongation factor Tu